METKPHWMSFEDNDGTLHGLICPDCAARFDDLTGAVIVADPDPIKMCNACKRTLTDYQNDHSA